MFEKEKIAFTDYLIYHKENSRRQPPYAKEEFYDFLDKIVNHNYDREVAEELYEAAHKLPSQEVSFNEFIRVYFEAENILLSQIDETSRKMISLKNEREDIRSKYDEAFKTEKINKFGVSDNNIFKVGLEGLDINDNSRYYENKRLLMSVIRDNGAEERESDVFLSGTRGQIVIKQNITLKNVILESEIILMLFLIDSLDKMFIGQIRLSSKNYEDQAPHFETAPFLNKRNQNVEIDLKFNVIWIYSKLKYYSDGLKKWDSKINFEEEKITSLKKKLNILYEPLRCMDNTKVANRKNSSMSQNIDLESHENIKRTANNFIKDEVIIYGNEGKNEKEMMIWTNRTKATILACLICIMFGIFFYLESGLFTKNSIKISFLILAYSVFIDMFWLCIYRSDSWAKNSFKINQNIEENLKLMSIIFSFLNIIFKVIITLLLNEYSNYCV